MMNFTKSKACGMITGDLLAKKSDLSFMLRLRNMQVRV